MSKLHVTCENSKSVQSQQMNANEFFDLQSIWSWNLAIYFRTLDSITIFISRWTVVKSVMNDAKVISSQYVEELVRHVTYDP